MYNKHKRCNCWLTVTVSVVSKNFAVPTSSGRIATYVWVSKTAADVARFNCNIWSRHYHLHVSFRICSG